MDVFVHVQQEVSYMIQLPAFGESEFDLVVIIDREIILTLNTVQIKAYILN